MRRLGLLLIVMAAAAAAIVVPAQPAAAATPQCRAWLLNGITGQGSCTDGDPAYQYMVILGCRGDLADPLSNKIYYLSKSAPTTVPITDVSCISGGFAIGVWADVIPPPPPSANLICDSGANNFVCQVGSSLAEPVQIRWTLNGRAAPGWNDLRNVSGTCISTTVITVTVSNATGSASDSWRTCRSGPWH